MDVRPARAAHWDVGETLADRFRAHVGDSQHLYGYAMRGMADDWESGGPIRMASRGYESAPRGALVQLRLLAGEFRLVLTGQAPELIRFYPCLGGTDPASEVWPVMREVIATHIEDVHAALAVAPQTNEVGRSAALLAGLFDLVAASGVRRICWSWERARASTCYSTSTHFAATLGISGRAIRRFSSRTPLGAQSTLSRSRLSRGRAAT